MTLQSKLTSDGRHFDYIDWIWYDQEHVSFVLSLVYTVIIRCVCVCVWPNEIGVKVTWHDWEDLLYKGTQTVGMPLNGWWWRCLLRSLVATTRKTQRRIDSIKLILHLVISLYDSLTLLVRDISPVSRIVAPIFKGDAALSRFVLAQLRSRFKWPVETKSRSAKRNRFPFVHLSSTIAMKKQRLWKSFCFG